MAPEQVLLYCGRAAVFALLAGACWAAGSLIASRKNGVWPDKRAFWWRLALVVYLAALVQITVIRDFRTFLSSPAASRTAATVQLIPLKTTLGEWQGGLWRFCYHVIGNMLWFIPFGALAPRASRRLRGTGGIAVAAACLSAAIELAQWGFATGISDVDDVLMSTLGALAGWMVFWKRAGSGYAPRFTALRKKG